MSLSASLETIIQTNSTDTKPNMIQQTSQRPPALVRLHHDGYTTTEVARTISRAFSDDPLVVYCRPGEVPWGTLDSRSLTWQTMRVRMAMLSCMVVGMVKTDQLAIEVESRECLESSDSGKTKRECAAELGAVAILHPPKSAIRQSWLEAFELWRLQFCEYMWPIYSGVDKERIGQVRTNHLEAIQKIEKLVGAREIWYLEVVAVKPELQGLRLGARIMDAIKAEAKDGVIMLESTSSASKRFYERHGFDVVREIVLGDPSTSDSVRYWTMLWTGS